jgi:transposase
MNQCRKLTLEERRELDQLIHKGQSTGPEVRRALAVLLLNDQVEIQTIKTVTKYERRQMFEIRRNYLEHGISAIQDKRQGKPKELLTKKQRDEIVHTVQKKTPKETDPLYGSDHWTTAILGDHIKRTYGVQYKSKTSYYLVFRQAKFTYHKPGRVYHERDQQEVEQWKTSTKPRLQQLWSEPNTVVLAGDEMILTTQTTIQKIWLPQGEYPRIEVSNQSRQRRNIYGFLNIRTGVEHAFKTLKQNMQVTREILQKIRSIYPKQKIALFWDSAGWHKGSAVREFIEQDGNIEVIHFPRYAPEENPQEHVWKEGRSHVSHNRFIENIDEATDQFVHYLKTAAFPYSLLRFSAGS